MMIIMLRRPEHRCQTSGHAPDRFHFLMTLMLARHLLQLCYLFSVAHFLVTELVNFPLEINDFSFVVDLYAMAVLSLPFQQLFVILNTLAIVLLLIDLTIYIRLRFRNCSLKLMLHLLDLLLQHLLR